MWVPKSWPQRQALECPARFLLFGGAAGALKTETALMDAIKYRENPRAKSLLFRKTSKEMLQMIERGDELYRQFGAEPRGGTYNRHYIFPSGMRVYMTGAGKDDKGIYQWQSWEFDYMGGDEAGMFVEKPIRWLIARNRTSDPSLQNRLRVRLYTNPNGPGVSFMKHAFIGPGCHHCTIERDEQGNRLTREPYQIYRNAEWESDRHQIGMSTCFIPGKLSDHNLLPNYETETLATLTAADRKKLKEGCWLSLEGNYFSNFDIRTMVIPRQKVGDEWWWNHWMGADYGFRGSAAAAGLWVRRPAPPPSTLNPNPRPCSILIDEYVARNEAPDAFGRSLKKRWLDASDGKTRRVLTGYLGPDSWSVRDDQHTIADQMIDGSGFGWEEASNDRAGGALLVYSGLDNSDLLIADNCKEAIRCLQTRQIDPDDSRKVRKDVGDSLDDTWDGVLRYPYYSYFRPAREPNDVRLKRIAAELKDVDPTSRAIRLREERAAMQDEGRPISYRRR